MFIHSSLLHCTQVLNHAIGQEEISIHIEKEDIKPVTDDISHRKSKRINKQKTINL